MVWVCDMLPWYNKSTESWMGNDVDKSITEVLLVAHSALVKEGTYHLPVVLFTKEILDSYKPILVWNIPPLKCVGGTTNRGITDNIQGDWGPNISVSVVITLWVPVEEALLCIGMNARRAVIHLKYYCKEDWLNLLEEGWPTQSGDQWV